jgi:hypothetical protein
MNHKNIKKRVTTTARDTTQVIFTDYSMFKENIRQVFGDIEQQNTTERELRHLKQYKITAKYITKFQ